MEMKKITMKQYKWNIRLTLLYAFLIGLLFGAILVYKVEINTINQALDSMSYCYEEYALNDYSEIKEDLRIEYTCQDNKGYWEFNDYGDYMNAINVLENLNCEVEKLPSWNNWVVTGDNIKIYVDGKSLVALDGSNKSLSWWMKCNDANFWNDREIYIWNRSIMEDKTEE